MRAKPREVSRRAVLKVTVGTVAVASVGGLGYYWKQAQDKSRWEEAVRATARTGAGETSRDGVLRELVHCATLAANSHNTQPWKFSAEGKHLSIVPDMTRRCPAVDPDDHHLFVSLGCALENMIQAAPAYSKHADYVFEPGDRDVLRVSLVSGPTAESDFFHAIPYRQSTRLEFSGSMVSTEALRSLAAAGTGEGVQVLLFDDRKDIESILDYLVQGNTEQMRDTSFIEELLYWIRFSYGRAVETRDGLFSKCSGNPVVPEWLGRRMFRRFFTTETENSKYVRQVRTSGGIAVFVSEVSDKRHWIEVGRCFERFALQATSLGLKLSFLNQPVEVSSVREQFADFLQTKGRRPDLVIRFGTGAEAPRSLRRPVEHILTL